MFLEISQNYRKTPVPESPFWIKLQAWGTFSYRTPLVAASEKIYNVFEAWLLKVDYSRKHSKLESEQIVNRWVIHWALNIS